MKYIITIIALSLSMSAAMAADAKLDPKVPCKIDYPKAALMNEEKGTVELSLLVLANGTIAEAKVEKSSGSKTLDKASVTSITKCKMLPPGGDKQWQILSYVWSLE